MSRQDGAGEPEVRITELPADQLDDVLQTLGVARRREMLRRLDDAQCPVALADIAHEIADHEHTPDNLERVRVALHHSDVPLLSEANLIEYSPDRETVALAPLARTPVVQTIIHLDSSNM